MTDKEGTANLIKVGDVSGSSSNDDYNPPRATLAEVSGKRYFFLDTVGLIYNNNNIEQHEK